ncbi:MAG: ATP12 family protein [Terricaulis silvestris]
MSIEAARRFYKDASVREDAGGFAIMLDERELKTPGQRPFRLPKRALAAAIAAEWQAQDKQIVPATMPMTRFAAVAIDHTHAARDERIGIVAKYAETDLVCHRADTPAALSARQKTMWDPLLAWAERDLNLFLPVVTGVIAADISPAQLAAVRWGADGLDDFALTALTHTAGLAGSCVIAFALQRGRLDAEGAFQAACLDDLWSQEKWGADAEAIARLDRFHAEFEEVARFFSLLA